MVLAGGPDRERPVSLQSGQCVAEALQRAGHTADLHDLTPEALGALDAFKQAQYDVVFPALHGPWGEGGHAQRLLEAHQIPYVGSQPDAAGRCMDKFETKQHLRELGIPTPSAEVLTKDQPNQLPCPVVVKPVDEGSSMDLHICRSPEQVAAARAESHSRHDRLLIESFVQGKEMTVGILERSTGQPEALPPIHIQPATEYYDYDAKYEREDTQYHFQIDLPDAVIAQIQADALIAHRRLGCRHLSRVDFLVDEEHRHWCLEVNTLPGFTTHSLLPMAAAHAGIPFPELTDHLVRTALS